MRKNQIYTIRNLWEQFNPQSFISKHLDTLKSKIRINTTSINQSKQSKYSYF